ncbi:hypothetical protein DRO97_09585 [Archaeoglobales archaeon]|nr:MAG: hypothetical protein DRO97_09585 [Archaeoglobales archaeon]
MEIQIIKGLVIFHAGLLLLFIGLFFGLFALPPPEDLIVVLSSIVIGIFLMRKGYGIAKD